MRTSNPARQFTVATLVAAALAMSACGGGSANSSATTTPTSAMQGKGLATHAAPGAASRARTPETRTALDAIATAQHAVAGGQVFNLESDKDHGKKVWEAEVADPSGKQFDFTITADGSKVIHRREDKSPDDDVKKLHAAKIPLKRAIGTAVSQAKKVGKLTSLEIDTTDGGQTLVWEIRFGGDTGMTAVVNAKNGTVVTVGPDAG
ncbi:PepSY domain-containing protein [Spelaeicoccus albus]|uniref:Putative membrane protein YkoI n=1 Tax=Spelaeicoccus albus TaxID=1280376 RepID=A0A7Z0D4G0_9MICO|nr:PepSY domain-containing protein [Spelaeicoccus albus]NYI68717.1 putative membrane protein YkoI [Spelaeicoccus albus]